MVDEAREILNENVIGSLATLNHDGSPWVTPVHVFSDNEAVYWFSLEDKQHSQNVDRDPRVSLTLFSPDMSHGPKAVYISGTVELLGVDDTTEAKKLIEAKIGKIPEPFLAMSGYRLKIGQLNRGKSTGNCWYFYT